MLFPRKYLFFIVWSWRLRTIQLFIDFIFYLWGDFYNPNSKVIVSHVASIDLLNLNQNNEFFFLKWLRVVVGEILNTKDYTVLDALKPCLCS